ncbi:hypothetical protein [Anatilimnocola floriformis]|uniref:hypothetical protein n=1 Tax=Anatilimnocola floriformis TaxID=2948575 RepID=UPI0020C23B11|nr:hypothetical protein [Anatilimnocola floriformis]
MTITAADFRHLTVRTNTKELIDQLSEETGLKRYRLIDDAIKFWRDNRHKIEQLKKEGE